MLPGLEDADDVGVVDRRPEGALAEKPLDELGIVQKVFVRDLDHHDPVVAPTLRAR